MTISEAAVLIIVAAVTAVVTTIVGAAVGKRFGIGTLAKESAGQKSELIEDLRTRLELAEQDITTSRTKAEAAEKMAATTERRRASCEDEIGRLKRDLRDTEAELLDLYRRTGTRAPRTLTNRHAERQREDAEDT